MDMGREEERVRCTERVTGKLTFSSVTQSCPTLCTPGLSVHHQLPEFTQTHVHRVGEAIQPSHPLSSPSLPAPNPSQHQGLFQWVNSSHEVAKVLEFSFSLSPSNEYSGLMSFRIDWFDLSAVQGTCKSLLQHYSSKASVLQCSAFFTDWTYEWTNTGIPHFIALCFIMLCR